MRKEISFKMSKQIIEMAEKPLRTREEAVLLLLYTIRMFDSSAYLSNDDRMERVNILIDKMNRIFYLIQGKIFSIQFPFCIDVSTDHGDITVYHNTTGIVINSRVLSFLISAFEDMKRKEMNFENIFDIIMGSEVEEESFNSKQMWILISYLLKYDLGYIRYDIDPDHENGKMHPLNHLDVCLDTSATYKIGLDRQITFDDFKSILNITTECWFINKK